MSGREKGLPKGGAMRHRKVLRDNIQGITKNPHSRIEIPHGMSDFRSRAVQHKWYRQIPV